MKKELDYFYVGRHYGGNQETLKDYTWHWFLLCGYASKGGIVTIEL